VCLRTGSGSLPFACAEWYRFGTACEQTPWKIERRSRRAALLGISLEANEAWRSRSDVIDLNVIERFAKVFRLAEGLIWRQGENRIRTETDLSPWRGARGAAGRSVPQGFPRSNRFG